MTSLPSWRGPTVAVLTTVGPEGPHSIPVSAPVRADERTILLSLHRSRGSLARIRADPQAALLVMADGAVFTARGLARIVARHMAGAPDFAAVELVVGAVDDHLAGLPVRAGLDGRVDTLLHLAVIRRRCRVAASTEEV